MYLYFSSPVLKDTIFNDTKSELSVNEKVNLDNSAHALMEVYTNNSKFLMIDTANDSLTAPDLKK